MAATRIVRPDIFLATATLTAADLLGLTLTSGATVVAAQGANTAVIPMPGGTALYTAGATPFTATKASFCELFFSWDGLITTTVQLGKHDWLYIDCPGFLDQAASQVAPVTQEPPGNPTTFQVPRAGMVNKALKVYFASIPDGDSIADGNGTLTLKLPYYTRSV